MLERAEALPGPARREGGVLETGRVQFGFQHAAGSLRLGALGRRDLLQHQVVPGGARIGCQDRRERGADRVCRAGIDGGEGRERVARVLAAGLAIDADHAHTAIRIDRVPAAQPGEQVGHHFGFQDAEHRRLFHRLGGQQPGRRPGGILVELRAAGAVGFQEHDPQVVVLHHRLDQHGLQQRIFMRAVGGFPQPRHARGGEAFGEGFDARIVRREVADGHCLRRQQAGHRRRQ